MIYAAAAGLLFAIFLVLLYGRVKAGKATAKAHLRVAEENADAREREDEAIREHDRVGDLRDDERFLPPPDGSA